MEKEIMPLAKKLISIESVADKPDKLAEVIDVCARELEGFTVEKFEKNNKPSILAYKGAKRPEQFDVVLNAHLDVVPARSEQFDPVEKNGKLYGRGASDMKAAAVVELIAFKEIAKSSSRPIALQLVTDEEVGGYDGTKHQVENGVRTSFVISGEPTDLEVGQKAKGVIWLDVKAKGKTAHGAYQWRGENALLKIKKAMDAIEQSYPVLTSEKWRTTVNVASIETPNKTYNKVPDECTLKLDVRYIPEDWKTIKESLTDLFQGFELTFHEFEPPQVTDESNRHYQNLLSSIKRVTNTPGRSILKHGASDVRHFMGVGAQGVEFGPPGAGLHSDEEWVNIEGLYTYHRILKDYLLHLG